MSRDIQCANDDAPVEGYVFPVPAPIVRIEPRGQGWHLVVDIPTYGTHLLKVSYQLESVKRMAARLVRLYQREFPDGPSTLRMAHLLVSGRSTPEPPPACDEGDILPPHLHTCPDCPTPTTYTCYLLACGEHIRPCARCLQQRHGAAGDHSDKEAPDAQTPTFLQRHPVPAPALHPDDTGA